MIKKEVVKMNIERGDSITFGAEWCKEHHREELMGRTVKLTPQYFEDDNGLYCYEREYPGVRDEESEESDSIYHLFGNEFERFMDCELIKGTEEDKLEYEEIVQSKNKAEEKAWIEFTSHLSE